MIDPSKFLEDMSGRYARVYFAAIHEMFVAAVRRDRDTAMSARTDLARAMAETLGVAEVLGARLAMQAASARMNFSAQTLIPRVTLTDALDDMVERAPVTLRNAAERTAQSIAKIYSEQNVMAFARSAEESVTDAAQQFISRAFRDGVDEGTAGQGLSMAVEQVRELSQPWSEAYSRMVFRTNVGTATTAGRFRMTRDPDIKYAVPAFRFDSVGDGDTRDNHDAADGIIMSVDNREWNRIAPPIGFSCRCQISHVTRDDLENLGRIRPNGSIIEDRVPPGAFPDPGFRHGGRPDLMMVGV